MMILKQLPYRVVEHISTQKVTDILVSTTVLSVLSRDSIQKWRQRVGEAEANKISHRASTRGTAVHDIVEKYLDNEVDLTKYTFDVIQSWKNLQPILDERLSVIYEQECPLYSKYLGVAGRVDCVGCI